MAISHFQSLTDFKPQVNIKNLKATYFVLSAILIASKPTLATALI